MDDTTIETETIKRGKFAVFILLYVFLGVFITAILAIKTHLELIIWIGMFLFIIAPGIFTTYFRKNFSNTVKILFTNEFFSVTGIENNVIAIPYREIKSIGAIDSAKDDSLCLKFYLKDNKYIEFSFIRQSNRYLKTPVLEVLLLFLNNYNTVTNPDSKITIAPSFFARKDGKIFIYIISTILAICILIQIYFKPLTIPFSLLSGLILYLFILAQRRRDLELIKKLN